MLLLQIGVVIPAAGINTHIGLILVYLGGAIGFNAFLLKGFMDSIPNSLDESAKVDGATSWQVFWGIILPLTRPVLVVIFIISFIGFYGEVLLATFLLTDTSQYTYAVGLSLFTTSQYTAKWGLTTAAAVIGRRGPDCVALPGLAAADHRWAHRGRSRGNTSLADGGRRRRFLLVSA